MPQSTMTVHVHRDLSLCCAYKTMRAWKCGNKDQQKGIQTFEAKNMKIRHIPVATIIPIVAEQFEHQSSL